MTKSFKKNGGETKRQAELVTDGSANGPAHKNDSDFNTKPSNTKPSKRQRTNNNSIGPDAYIGYRFGKHVTTEQLSKSDLDRDETINKLDIIDLESISSEQFYHSYIAKRKPCIINIFSSKNESNGIVQKKNGGDPSHPNDATKVLQSTTIESILQTLLNTSNVQVQVEKRQSTKEVFGQNRTPDRQITINIDEFVRLILPNANETNTSKELYYLSTQQPESTVSNRSEETEQAKEESIPLPFDTDPCRLLLKTGLIPLAFPLVGPNMVLDSCNFWMGSSSPNGDKGADNKQSGSNSGLHHDYHDNFYWVLAGRKHFRIYPPHLYPFMHLYGEKPTIQPNGVISYNPREDTILTIGSDENSDYDDDNEDDNSEEVILGKGFDYKSDDESDEGFDNNDTKDDFDELYNDEDDESKDSQDSAKESAPGDKGATLNRPDNFSKIDLTLSDAELDAKFPEFRKNCQNGCCELELEPGQCLYLPASWFHCVTSYGKDPAGSSERSLLASEHAITIPSTLHAAFNYWYHPPDNLENYEQPYSDFEYWNNLRQTVLKHVSNVVRQNT